MFLAAFVWLERRNAQAMIDVRLFRSQAFVGALHTMTGYGAAIQVLIFLLPLYLQTVYGFAPIIAGLATIPFAFPMVIARGSPHIYLGICPWRPCWHSG